MQIDLSDKKVLVTGASKGIGLYIAKAFIDCNSVVSIISNNYSNLKKAEKFINNKNLNIIKYDLNDLNNYKSLLKTVEKKNSGIDTLICNFGKSKPNSIIGEEGHKQFKQSFINNFLSSTEIINQSKKYLKKSKNGSIICIGSIAGFSNVGAPIDYSASKAALLNFVKNQSKILSKDNIRINMISPGNIYIKNGTWDKKLNKNKNLINKYIRDIVPLKRFGRPEEIANAAVFLSSNYSKFITGINLIIDGGQSA